MLGVLCARHKPWIVSALSFTHHGRLSTTTTNSTTLSFLDDQPRRRRHHSTACLSIVTSPPSPPSIWHAILPSARDCGANHGRRLSFHHEQKGEGSWNVALDSRPARWLHNSDSAWLLFGVCPCACVVPNDCCGGNLEALVGLVGEDAGASIAGGSTDKISSDGNDKSPPPDYKVTGVLADGRCLFRAVVHGACLINGEEAPDEIRQRELADDLRAQVVDELLKRRKETEWFIEGDFDEHVKSIQQPNVWGGEPELLMASHVLQTPISVFMIDRKSGKLTNIANYGKDYAKNDNRAIKVLFHKYGHYEVLETFGTEAPESEI